MADAYLINAPFEVPRELAIAWDMRRHAALPDAGGILDQEAGLLRRAGLYVDAFDAWLEFRRQPAGHGADWQLNNPDRWKLVNMILEAREET